MSKVKTITIRIPIETAMTLHGLIDGCLGTSFDDDFTSEMTPLRALLEKKIIQSRLLTKYK